MLTKGSILVADDEINLCRILGAKLSKNGYNVVAVHDGQQAIEKVRESDFDVVLLDLILPKIDGLTALSEIRSLKSSLPVIIMTACENSEAVEKAMSNGASAFVNKPFDLDNLVSLVQNTFQKATSDAGKKPADSTVLFMKNQPVILDIQNGKCTGRYQSVIEERDDHSLTVLAPMRGEEYVNLAPRTPVKVGLAGKDAFYNFSSYVMIQKMEPVPVLILDKPGVIYRVQRRQSPRVEVRTQIRYSKVDEGDREGELNAGITSNIGTGGIGFLVREEIAPGQTLYVETDPIMDFGSISAVGQVVHCRKLSESEKEQFEIGLRFSRVNEKVRSHMA